VTTTETNALIAARYATSIANGTAYYSGQPSRGQQQQYPDYGSAAITFALLALADALRPAPVTVNVVAPVAGEDVVEAVAAAVEAARFTDRQAGKR